MSDPDHNFERGSSGAGADMAVEGRPNRADYAPDAPATRAVPPLADGDKPDQLKDAWGNEYRYTVPGQGKPFDLTSLGADVLWLDYLEAIYRGTPAYYQSNEALFGPVNQGDLALDEQLGTLFLNLAERAPLAAFYAPLGVGHHVDHQLVCSAADRLAQRKVNVKFFEDFPYVSRPGALEARQSELGIPMEFELTEISGQIRDKEEAIALYKSQVPQLFSTEDNMRQALRAYSSSLRRTYPGIVIERYWSW